MRKFTVLCFVIAIFGLTNSCNLFSPDATGQIVFWSDFFGPNIDVFLEEEYKGTIRSFYDTAPDCNSTGSVTISLEPGTYYNWEAEEDGYPYRSWNKDHTYGITAVENSCRELRLYTSSTKEALIEFGFSSRNAQLIGHKTEN